MAKLINEIGNQYGYLTVIARVENEGTRAKWRCQCKCGKIIDVIGKNLRNGNTRSCGCLAKKLLCEKHKDKHADMIGKIYGYLTILDYGGYAIKPDGRKDRLMKCQCNLCGSIKEIRCSDLKLGKTISCGCINSRGNTFINLFLKEHKINFQSEYKIESCKDIRPLPFDFAIFDKNNNLFCLIEYQGRQHYNCDQNNGWNNSKNFEIIQKHDKIKLDYCLTNNINLVRISYKENLSHRLEEVINGLQC